MAAPRVRRPRRPSGHRPARRRAARPRPWPAAAAIVLAAAGAAAAGPVADVRVDLPAEWRAQFHELAYHLEHNRKWFEKKGPEAFRRASLILESDRDPADVVLRRTAALLDRLSAMPGGARLADQRKGLRALRARARQTPPDEEDARYALYEAACALRRRIALANPLLSFEKVLFVKRHRSGYNHMCDQFFGFHARPGGGVFVLCDAFGEKPRVRDLLAGVAVESGRLAGEPLSGGAFLAPDLSFDGRRVVFAYAECDRKAKGKWSKGRSWHVFALEVDPAALPGSGGRGLRQLTDGTWNDFDPCWLPSGRIAFVSERRGGYGRCHGRAVPTYTLHTMGPDGSDVVCISFHETNEWQPSVNGDGLIVYTRWDYVDRDSDIAHHPWVIAPDGRDARAIHGNYPRFPNGRHGRPWMELDVRAIPGSRRYVATAAPHHGQAYGSVVVLDPDVADDDAMAQLRRITPHVRFPEAERGREFYGTAWPLSEEFYLCVAARPTVSTRKGRTRLRSDRHYGLYLLDAFGNRVLLYRDPTIGCRDPIPLRPRPKPPALPHMAAVGRPPGAEAPAAPGREGVFACINVYDSLKPYPAGARITHLRIVQLYPKATPSVDRPRIGIARQSLARGVLGVVPVEADGSCHFVCPADKAVYFQAVDERGLAWQSMRSDTWVLPGQRVTCQGCHERRYRAPAPPAAVPLALRRPPSRIRPAVADADPILFPRLVQPVLDRRCVGCHEREKKAPSLGGEVAAKARHGWSASYRRLAPMGHWYNGGNGAMRDRHHGRSRTIPGQFGARASKLMRMLLDGHHDVKLNADELRRLAVWIDGNTNFYGAYRETDAQARGKVVRPAVE